LRVLFHLLKCNNSLPRYDAHMLPRLKSSFYALIQLLCESALTCGMIIMEYEKCDENFKYTEKYAGWSRTWKYLDWKFYSIVQCTINFCCLKKLIKLAVKLLILPLDLKLN
jgi:hypothetical protein